MSRRTWYVILAVVLAVGACIPLARFLVVRIPQAVGLDAGQTSARFDGSGVHVALFDADGERIGEDEWDDYGPVLRQEPEPGSYLVRGMTLRLYVERQEREVSVPFLVGLFLEDARNLLEESSLVIEYAGDNAPSANTDVVISQEPTVGATVIAGSAVRVDARFPHTSAGMTQDVRSIHGIFYLRNGIEGAQLCNPCHGPETCGGEPCHTGSAYELLQLAYPPPGP